MMRGTEETWLVLRSEPLGAALNMAWDEALLEAVGFLGLPILRFYAWSEPAASFGYFQRHEEVERLIHLRPLVRRPTGGGIVPHNRDWTYSMALPTAHPWYRATAHTTYALVHQWLRSALRLASVETTLATDVRDGGGRCFAGASRYDLLFCGRKIAGAALRRTRNGLLIQGSVQPPAVAPPRPDWEIAMQAVARQQMGANWHVLSPHPHVAHRAHQLAEQKYARADYNQCR